MPGFIVVPLGNLDDDPGARPLAHIFVGSNAAWYDVAGDLPCFEAYPPGIPCTAGSAENSN